MPFISVPPLDSRTPVKESICKGTFYKLYQHDGFHLLSLCSLVQLDFSISISGIDFYFIFFVFVNDFHLPSENGREPVQLRAGDGGKKRGRNSNVIRIRVPVRLSLLDSA